MKKKIIVLLVMVAAGTLLLMGCGGTAEIPRPQPSEGAKMVTVTGNCEAALEGNTLKVTGTTNLMDGTNGVITVLNSDGTTVEEQKFTKQGDVISHDFTVTDEWPERVYAYVSFDTQQADKQPKEVTETYGKKFENLEGEDVIWDLKGVIAVFQSEMIEVK